MQLLAMGAGGVGAAFTSIAASRQVFSEIVRADIIVSACDPRLNPPVFDAAFEAGCHYLDMAMHMSTPHPTHPYEHIGVMLGDAQFAVSDQWAERGQLSLCAMGVEPRLSDVLARYASDHLFSSISEVGVRDGSDLVIDGFSFAPTFSIWTTIEECLNPPIIWERERGWFTTAPFSEPETFVFPEGIGPLGCVNVDHEEVVLMPRWLTLDRVTFKYGLGDDFIEVLSTLRRLGLDGAPREAYLYQVVDNEWTMRTFGHQAVVWQTAVHPVVACELIAEDVWSDAGVMSPEAFSADPFFDLLQVHGVSWSLEERTPSLA